MRLWPFSRRVEKRSVLSLSDPRLVELLGIDIGPNYSGVEVSESSVLGISAVYRAVSLISGTLAGLPLPTLVDENGQLRRVASWLDTPGGPEGPTPYEWKETVLLHLLLHGNAYLRHIRGGAGQMMALEPIHPMCVDIEAARQWPDGRPAIGGRLMTVSLESGGQELHDATTMTHIPGPTTDGVRGISPITVARNSLGTTIAGDRAAAKLFSQGALHSGLITPDGDELDEGEDDVVREVIERRVTGWENAGGLRFVNRRLKFSPWTMNAADAQFLESRAFQIEEVARWYGVPPHKLMQTEKQTSWGTGVAESNRGMSREVLATWAGRLEQRLSRLLRGRIVQFDFSGMERPNPEIEVPLIISQYRAGLITRNEARGRMGVAPADGGDTFYQEGGQI